VEQTTPGRRNGGSGAAGEATRIEAHRAYCSAGPERIADQLKALDQTFLCSRGG